MNRETRRKVAKRLREFRKQIGFTPEELEARLGWPAGLYRQAESGTVGLSAGQVNDMRRVLKEAVAAATVRDNIRRKPRGGIIRLPGQRTPGGVIGHGDV